jgi:hypothetical protein
LDDVFDLAALGLAFACFAFAFVFLYLLDQI